MVTESQNGLTEQRYSGILAYHYFHDASFVTGAFGTNGFYFKKRISIFG